MTIHKETKDKTNERTNAYSKVKTDETIISLRNRREKQESIEYCKNIEREEKAEKE